MASKSIDNAFTAKTLRGAATDPTYAGVLSFMRRKYSKDLTDVDKLKSSFSTGGSDDAPPPPPPPAAPTDQTPPFPPPPAG